jgi:sulfite exporter TauE/SafE
MLSSISPLGERARSSRWWVTTAAYLLGSLAGGLALGGIAAMVGSVLPDDLRTSRWTLVVVALLLLVGLVLDLRAAP